MEILEKLDKKVDDIHKYIFEGAMDEKYVSKDAFQLTVEFMKEQLKLREKEISDLKKNQNKVAWIIISAVIVALLGIIVGPKIF